MTWRVKSLLCVPHFSPFWRLEQSPLLKSISLLYPGFCPYSRFGNSRRGDTWADEKTALWTARHHLGLLSSKVRLLQQFSYFNLHHYFFFNKKSTKSGVGLEDYIFFCLVLQLSARWRMCWVSPRALHQFILGFTHTFESSFFIRPLYRG